MTPPVDPKPQTTTKLPDDRPNGDRRRFIVAGLAAAPLLVTLTARPAHARQTGTLGLYGYAT
jgi:hypothetical protein